MNSGPESKCFVTICSRKLPEAAGGETGSRNTSYNYFYHLSRASWERDLLHL